MMRLLTWRPEDRAALYGVLSYIVLPYLLVQVGNLGLLRRGRETTTDVALTFDDGPDPSSTPFVLDALREAGVKATFFVVGERLRQHPDLARRIAAEGHEIGLHCDRHKHAWIRSPWDSVRDLRRVRRTFREVLGYEPTLYRPPHGAYTLVTILAVQFEGLQGAHWTVMGNDWIESMTAGSVVKRVLTHLRPGGVIVLHDAGPGARLCVPALPLLLKALQDEGLRTMPIGALPNLRPETVRDLFPRLRKLLTRSWERT